SKMNKVEQIVPNYSYVFNFEKSIAYQDILPTITDHYPTCFYCCAIYIALIFSGKRYMLNRPRFELKGVLILWNALLALFSIFGFIRMRSELSYILHYGFDHSICLNSLAQDRIKNFWSLMFILSKLVEFGDTVFIILRKQPLMFLHWYHHVTVLLYAWLCFIEDTAYSRWNGTINFFIHSWMYSYYTLKAMRFNPPKWVTMTITTLQIVQMIWGCFITIIAYNYARSGEVECSVTLHNAQIGLLIYFSYLILFVRFFIQSYLLKKHEKKVNKSEKKSEIDDGLKVD
ncbi:unnamed protein product, partial [Heterotrigona itama]